MHGPLNVNFVQEVYTKSGSAKLIFIFVSVLPVNSISHLHGVFIGVI